MYRKRIWLLLLTAVLLAGCGQKEYRVDTVVRIPAEPTETVAVQTQIQETVPPETGGTEPVETEPEETGGKTTSGNKNTSTKKKTNKKETASQKETEPVPTEAPTQPETLPVTEPPTEPETLPATEPPTEPETLPVTEPPTEPETLPVTEPPTEPETIPATEPPTEPETLPATEPPTEPETLPATEPPAEPETIPVTEPPTEPETAPPTEAPTQPPATCEPEVTQAPTEPLEPETEETPEEDVFDPGSYRPGDTERELLEEINQYRADVDVASLKLNRRLSGIAALRAMEMAQLWSHTRPDGRDYTSALTDHGCGFSRSEELAVNISGSWPVGDIVKKWMNSGKGEILEDPAFTKAGVGMYKEGNATVIVCLLIG